MVCAYSESCASAGMACAYSESCASADMACAYSESCASAGMACAYSESCASAGMRRLQAAPRPALKPAELSTGFNVHCKPHNIFSLSPVCHVCGMPVNAAKIILVKNRDNAVPGY